MTLVAKSLDERCKAFTEDRRPCRLSCAKGKKTCSIHRNYFINWFQKNTYLPLEYMETMQSRKYKEYNAIIGNKILPIPESYVSGIPSSDIYIPFYIYLCKHGADSFWNKGCFIAAIKIVVDNVFTNFFCRNILHLEEENYIHLFNNIFISPVHKKEGIKYIILYFFYKTLNLYNLYDDALGKHNVITATADFLNNMLRYTDFKTILFSDLSDILDEVKGMILTNYNAYIIDFLMNTIILVSLENTKQDTKNNLRNRCNIFKEELMAYVYHPDRIFPLINKYGMNILDDY